jgi:hypothetical protein
MNSRDVFFKDRFMLAPSVMRCVVLLRSVAPQVAELLKYFIAICVTERLQM